MATRRLPLVGRDDEVAALEAELGRARAGEFRVVVLLGDPGVGKSRLAAEVLDRQRGRALTLTARAYPLGGTAPFGLRAEAFESHLRSLGTEDVLRLCDGVVHDLAGLLVSAAAARGGPPEQEPPRVRVLAALAVLLHRLAGTRPVVLVLDDVHEADASSWEALAYLARNAEAAPVLVIATARAAELADQRVASQVLFSLEQDGTAERFELAPLPDRAVGDLARAALGGPPPKALVSWLAERSRGNPLFALGLLHALVEEGADVGAPHLHTLPAPLAERVRSRVRRSTKRGGESSRRWR